MNKQQIISQINAIFEQSCRDVFTGLDCAFLDAKPPESDVVASTVEIDASSSDLYLDLQLQIPKAILQLSHPMRDSDIDMNDEVIQDWNLELANRILGKVKGRLATRAGQLKLGLPVQKQQTDDDHVNDNANSTTMFFEIEHEVFACQLRIEILNDKLELETTEEDALESEGELELF